MKPTVYVETTVVSYLVARPARDIVVLAHQEITRSWWETAADRFDICVSQAVLEEVARGDAQAASSRVEALKGFGVLPLTDEVEALAQVYLDRLAIPERSIADAVHLAVASVHATDYLLTWNCAHIANAEIRRALAQINSEQGVGIPIICTPEELMGR